MMTPFLAEFSQGLPCICSTPGGPGRVRGGATYATMVSPTKNRTAYPPKKKGLHQVHEGHTLAVFPHLAPGSFPFGFSAFGVERQPHWQAAPVRNLPKHLKVGWTWVFVFVSFDCIDFGLIRISTVRCLIEVPAW